MSLFSRIIQRRGIQEPMPDLNALTESVAALKEVVETLTRQRGNFAESAVTVEDLVDLGIIQRRSNGRFIKTPD